MLETHKIPKSMVLNLDQTPVKYVPCDKATLAKQNKSSVPVSDLSDRLSELINVDFPRNAKIKSAKCFSALSL